jgi:hypothetical protein
MFVWTLGRPKFGVQQRWLGEVLEPVRHWRGQLLAGQRFFEYNYPFLPLYF